MTPLASSPDYHAWLDRGSSGRLWVHFLVFRYSPRVRREIVSEFERIFPQLGEDLWCSGPLFGSEAKHAKFVTILGFDYVGKELFDGNKELNVYVRRLSGRK